MSASTPDAKPVTVALAGVGGYGGSYLNYLDHIGAEKNIQLVAGIDPAGEKAARWNELKTKGVALFTSLDDFYASTVRADLMLLALPIHLHAPETIRALEHGLHVIVEKPLCATLDEAARMIAARDKAGKIVAVGYQASFSDSVLNLKADIMAGKFGRAKRLKTLVLWPRKRSYYQRSAWAGARQSRNGSWVLDSPANNATAHFLHNMFFVLGDRVDRSAPPVEAQAELYRANPITNFDTGVARFRTADGAELLYYCAHPVESLLGPRFIYEFEKGTVIHDRDTPITANFTDGTVKNYGSLDQDQGRKLWKTVDAIRGGAPIPCTIEAAMNQTRAIDGMQRSVPEVVEFPAAIGRVKTEADGDTLTYVDGLVDVLTTCYEENKLPHEVGVPWARKGQVVTL